MSDRDMERALAADAAKLEALGQDSGRVPASPPATGKAETWQEAARLAKEELHRPVPASPRDCFCGECAAVDRPCASCVAKGLGEFATPVASGTPKGQQSETCPYFFPAPAAPGVDGLDFEAANQAGLRATDGDGSPIKYSRGYQNAINAQVRDLLERQRREILEKLCPKCYLTVSSVIAGDP